MSHNVTELSKAFPKTTFLQDLKRYRFLFLLTIPGMICYLVFSYAPMFGIVIAFQDFRLTKGFLGSEWVGFKYFVKFFTNAKALSYVKNTLLLNVYGLLWGFPLPIIFAIMLANVKNVIYRKVVQTVSFLPHFISVVVVVSLIKSLLHVNEGLINKISVSMGGTATDYLMNAKYFRTIYVVSGIWQSFGWDSIIYLAAITSIDPQLYESAMIDGANSIQKIWHITLPCIRSTIIILLILSIGSLMNSSFDEAYLLQTTQNLKVSEVIATYVYKRGILASGGGYPEFSYTTAIGLSQSFVNVILLVTANWISKKITETSLF